MHFSHSIMDSILLNSMCMIISLLLIRSPLHIRACVHVLLHKLTRVSGPNESVLTCIGLYAGGWNKWISARKE